MSHTAAFRILTLILILGDLESVTVVNHHPDEEYFLEHEVLYDDAIAEAKKMEVYTGPIAGCKPCTNSEMAYCKDGSVINDHCCCDGNFNKKNCLLWSKNSAINRVHLCQVVILPGTDTEPETFGTSLRELVVDPKVFPFVKHTCRVGPEECKVQAGNCAEYTRLRECCCHSYLASFWKFLANDARSHTDTNLTKFLAIVMVLRLLLRPV